ncbi:hypothetical protein B0O99DRAFT_645205 [Bisporella sp. PMI_857]|nr:hypothetical protein B0O99DRAFT_645205 [Bisporella sp. PMI_857]
MQLIARLVRISCFLLGVLIYPNAQSRQRRLQSLNSHVSTGLDVCYITVTLFCSVGIFIVWNI